MSVERKNWLTKAGLIFVLVLGFASTASAMDPDFARFVGEKSRQIREFEKSGGDKVPSIVWSYFDALRVDDWQTATNLAERIDLMGRMLGTNTISPALQGPIWQPIGETIGTYDQFHDMDNRWLHRFGSNIISSIPKGSVYFGGTDAGRYVVSAMCESQTEGVPFFTLTQNQLVDGRYAQYIRLIYGGKLALPSEEDVTTTFREYLEDASARKKAGRLKPGEEVQTTRDGHAQVSGRVAVMTLNGMLVKCIFDKNPTREFYVEESFSFDWMYPQLEPHGLIMRLNREPLKRLSEAVVRKDTDFWKRQTADALGDWLDDGTSIRDICSFCNKVYLHKDFAGFKGDTGFTKSSETQKNFSKLRNAIAGLYAWHAEHDESPDDKLRMRKAADFAYRQALALCPYLQDTVFDYTQFLATSKRMDDAVLVAETAARIEPDATDYAELLKELHKANE